MYRYKVVTGPDTAKEPARQVDDYMGNCLLNDDYRLYAGYTQ